MTARSQGPRVLRYSSSDELADAVASQLLTRLIGLQATGEVNLCLTGGRIANRMYESLAALAEGSDLDPSKLHIWWGDERFVSLSDPDRNASQSFGILARTISLRPGQTHAMPAKDGRADSDEAAFSYAQELGDTVFDVCLLGMGEDGHVASLFPKHPSFTQSTSATVIGVTDSPKPPAERVSLTMQAINRSRAVWVMVGGEGKAEAVKRTIGGDETLPSTAVQGREETFFFLDQAAASLLPRYNCLL